MCKHEGLSFLGHNELCDLTADWLKEVCHNVAVEPPLLSLDEEAIASANRSDEARANVHATGFWGGRQLRCIFRHKGFHLATSGLNLLHFLGSMKEKEVRGQS